MLKKVLIGLAGVAGLGLLLYSAVAPDTRLVNAAQNSDWDRVRALIKQNVSVNTPQGDGTTALHWAAFEDNVVMAKVLYLAAGANRPLRAWRRSHSLTCGGQEPESAPMTGIAPESRGGGRYAGRGTERRH